MNMVTLIPLLFIFELSKALEKSKALIKSYSDPNFNRLKIHDHPYSKHKSIENKKSLPAISFYDEQLLSDP